MSSCVGLPAGPVPQCCPRQRPRTSPQKYGVVVVRRPCPGRKGYCICDLPLEVHRKRRLSDSVLVKIQPSDSAQHVPTTEFGSARRTSSDLFGLKGSVRARTHTSSALESPQAASVLQMPKAKKNAHISRVYEIIKLLLLILHFKSHSFCSPTGQRLHGSVKVHAG